MWSSVTVPRDSSQVQGNEGDCRGGYASLSLAHSDDSSLEAYAGNVMMNQAAVTVKKDRSVPQKCL